MCLLKFALIAALGFIGGSPLTVHIYCGACGMLLLALLPLLYAYSYSCFVCTAASRAQLEFSDDFETTTLLSRNW